MRLQGGLTRWMNAVAGGGTWLAGRKSQLDPQVINTLGRDQAGKVLDGSDCWRGGDVDREDVEVQGWRLPGVDSAGKATLKTPRRPLLPSVCRVAPAMAFDA